MTYLLSESDYICPHCGLVCHSLTAFHQHVKRVHEKEGPKNEETK